MGEYLLLTMKRGGVFVGNYVVGGEYLLATMWCEVYNNERRGIFW